MSTSVFQPAHELSCPNCGAPCALPAFGNQVECEYCGTRFLLPATRHSAAPEPVTDTPSAQVISIDTQRHVARWVKWLVILIVVTAVVPVLCSVVIGICGAFGAFVPFFVR